MFYGREDILEQLGGLLKKRTASLVTCRVAKDARSIFC